MKVDRLGLVEKIRDGIFKVDPSLVSGANVEICKYRNKEYYVGLLPGAGLDSLVFRVIRRDDYTHEGDVLEEVHDVGLVRRIIDRVIQREGYETVYNKPRKHKCGGDE